MTITERTVEMDSNEPATAVDAYLVATAPFLSTAWSLSRLLFSKPGLRSVGA